MFAILRWLVSLFALLSSANNTTVNTQEPDEKEIILQADSTLVVTAWQGSAKCNNGQILLQEPAAKTQTPYKLPTVKSPIIGSDLIFDHIPKTRETIVLGPYTRDTEVVFAFKFAGNCSGSFTHRTERVSVDKYPNGVLEMGIENKHDRDFNDFHLEVVIKEIPKEVTISSSVNAKQAFNVPANYRFPWPVGKNYPVTKGPGVDDHVGRAFDFGMKRGDEVRASEKGMVLWVEDSFGPGTCNLLYLGRVNVVVIQTEEGVNQNYLHLQQNSVKEAGIEVGDIVEQGEFIGRSGKSGYVCPLPGGTGEHLHIEWVRNCYDLKGEKEKRVKYPVGKPTLTWNCPNYPSNAPFNFN